MIKYKHSEKTHNTIAAEIILPAIFNLIHPRSVLDVGCGLGTWLKIAKKLGANDILGIDGQNVDRVLLKKFLEPSEFIDHNLDTPFDFSKKFDLVLCLEVAEHLPSNSAFCLIESLVTHSDNILFSASVPGQGGQNHINEQWPQYWMDIFGLFGYKFYDVVRPVFWNDSRIEFWYRQNIFLVSKNKIDSNIYSGFAKIHPELYMQKEKEIQNLKNELKKVYNGDVSLRTLINILKNKFLQ